MTREGFEWRLDGPVGPTALAKAFVGEAKQSGEAAFFLAELALSLSRVQADQVAAGGVELNMVYQLLSEAVAQTQRRAEELSVDPAASASLRQYVERAFEVAGR